MKRLGVLTHERNRVGLMAVNWDVISEAETWDRSDRTVLDMELASILTASAPPGPIRRA
jgi:hypothetical protein